MGGWGFRVGALLFTALLSGCASRPLPIPTKENPSIGCHIICPNGVFSRVNHLCKYGRRQFEDVLIIGENVVRNVDGTLSVDEWTVRKGDNREHLPKVAIVRMSCSSYVAQIIALREPDQRGRHPGETADGKSLSAP